MFKMMSKYNNIIRSSLIFFCTKDKSRIKLFRHLSDESRKPANNFIHLRRVWGNLFGKYLLVTNIVSSGVLMSIGDVMSQELEYQRGVVHEKRCDVLRIFRMFAVGSLQGPLHHYFYKWMDDIMPIATAKSSVNKILLDQFVMSPACILLFFYPACLLENKTIEQSNAEIRAKFLTVYTVDWCVWPAAQFINFYYLHPKYRVIYVNVVTMLYNVFLSYIKHKEMVN